MPQPLSCWSRRVSAVTVLALALGGCSSGGVSRPAGFSTAYSAATDDVGAGPAFHAIRGTGAGSAWAVGEGGLAVRLQGYTFSPVGSSTTATLAGLSALDVGHAFAVERGGPQVFAWTGVWAPLGDARADRAGAATWAAAPNSVWVVGNGIDHWDGNQWTQQVPSGTSFSAIAGSFDTDVWAVGPGGVQHWDGKAWTAVPTPTGTPALTGVWSFGLFDTWIVGAAGTVLHWGGSGLTRLAPPTTKDLTCIAGTGTFDVWVGGQDGELAHWDGQQWTEVASPAGRTIQDLWTALGSDLFFVDGASTITRYAQ